MPAQQSWVNRIISNRLVTIEHEYYAFPKYGDEPVHHPVHKHFAQIDAAIDQLDCNALLDLLTYDIQCSAVQDSKPIALDNNGKETPAEYLITTRPFLEGLLQLNIDNFISLVEAIAKKNDVDLVQAFIASLQNTSLKPEQLFGWSTAQHNRLAKGIREIKIYGNYLKKNNIAKGDIILELSETLTRESSWWQIYRYEDKSKKPVTFDIGEAYQEDMFKLARKLKFCRLLHSEDAIINKHRDTASVICDIVLGVCSAGVFNLINYMTTGHFLFFNQTASQSRIQDIDTIVRPYPPGY
jgi:hypothetical protein